MKKKNNTTSEKTMETMGIRIRRTREAAGLTQQKIADQVKVSNVTVSQWERDETQPRGKNLLELCKFLKCSESWLMHGDGHQIDTETEAALQSMRRRLEAANRVDRTGLLAALRLLAASTPREND